MDFLDKSKISYCDKCKIGESCNFCHGHKYFITISDKLIYFEYSFDDLSIKINQIKDIVRAILNSILFVISLLGIFAMLRHIYLIEINSSNIFSIESWLGLYPLVFWISILFTMFLTYRMKSYGHTKKKVVKYPLNNSSFGKNRKGETKPKLEPINVYDSFDINVKKYIVNSFYISRKNGFNNVLPIHLFLALLEDDSLSLIFARLGIDKSSFREKTTRYMKSMVSQNNGLSDFDLVMFNSYYIASKSTFSHINVGHVLMSLVMTNEVILELFLDSGINIDQIKNVIEWIRLGDVLRESYRRSRSVAIFKPKGDMNRAMTAVATPYLDSFSEDLTMLARDGYLSANIIREEKLQEIFRSIETNDKSVLLVGYPGVGKDNIINSLANLMSTEDVPSLLQDKRLVSLSLSRFVSFAASEGRVQENFLRLMNEVIRAGNIILIISNIHNMVGVSSQGIENIDLSEVLLDLISKYNVMIIGTSDPKSYSKYLENHPIATVMSKIEILEPDFNETVQILESKTFSVEYKYKVFFSYQALERIVKLTNNYFHDQPQPLKSVKILEEVAILVKKQQGENKLITSEHVSRLVSDKIHIPLSQVSISESEKLLRMEEILHQRIVGQDEAVKMVSSALRRARAEIRDEKKPITNLLFLGPTGVGKTELAKAVAEAFFGNENNMIRLDMSEYQDSSSIMRLIGMEGSGEGGILNEAIKKNPFSLLLLDEIEKAHPDILNVFLQIMDEGRLTSSIGAVIDFSNCIIIGTSNAAAFYLQDQIQKGIDIDTIKRNLLESELRPHFKPEFLNRFNGIVLFKPLTQIEIEQITQLLLKRVAKRLQEKGIDFMAEKEAVKELAKQGFSKDFGARPLKRTIESSVDDALANYLLSGKIGRRDKVILEKGLNIRIEKARRF